MSAELSLHESPLPEFEERQDAIDLNSEPARQNVEIHWRSRDYLPHFDQPRIVQSVTIRLGDALPTNLLLKWRCDLAHLPAGTRELELRSRIEDHLDAGHGACWLQRPEIGRLVEDAFLLFDGSRYRLLGWCVMPNHAHAIVEVLEGWEVGPLAHAWKSDTGNEATKLLGRRGGFWQGEHLERAVTDGFHLENALRYVENDPVKAGLVEAPEAWPFSSARFARGVPSSPVFESE